MTQPSVPSGKVLDLFVVPDDVQPIAGSSSVTAGDLVLSPGRDAPTAEWLNPALARLAVRLDERPGRQRRDLRLAVPVPARDGAWVVDGWGAARFEPGTAACHDLDVLVATGRALHAELAVALPRRPDELELRDDRWARAERLAFGPMDDLLAAEPHSTVVAHLAGELAGDVELGRSQLVHADLAGNVLLDPAGAPLVIDFSPAWRPPLWAEAVCVLDSVVRDRAPVSVVQRWSDRAGRQAMLRAVLFRALSDPPGLGPNYTPVLHMLDH